MGQAFPGYVAPTQFGVDAGVLYVGTTPVGMGATAGGLQFDPGQDIRHPDFDGKVADIADLHRVIDYSKNKLSGAMLDLSGSALGRYSPGSSSDGSATNTITPIAGQTFFSTGAYLQDVSYYLRRSDNSVIRVYMAYALVNKYTVKSVDKNEVKVDIEITAVLAPGATDLNACPYVWQEV